MGGKDRRRRQRAGPEPAIAIRSNFNPLAAFSPAVKTDATGEATVERQDARQPDALPHRRDRDGGREAVRQGRERADRAAAADGAAEPAAVPELRRHVPAAGRGAEPDRRADDGEGSRCATTNAALTDGAGREVTVPANDRVEVQFPAAAEMAGTARFQIVGDGGEGERRRRGRAAGVDAGDDRGVRDVRRDRRRGAAASSRSRCPARSSRSSAASRSRPRRRTSRR